MTENSEGLIEITQTTKEHYVESSDKINNDTLVQAIIDGSGTFELLDIVITELAKDCAHLKDERDRFKKEKNNQLDRIITRRAGILKTILDAIVQKRNLALSDIVNLKSPQWQVVFDLFLKKIRMTFSDLRFAEEQIELFFKRLEKNMTGFEEETEQKIKDSFMRTS